MEHGWGCPQVEAAGDVSREDGPLVGGQECLPEPVGDLVEGPIRGISELKDGRGVQLREVDVPGERRRRPRVGEPEEADGGGEGAENVEALQHIHIDGLLSFGFSVTGSHLYQHDWHLKEMNYSICVLRVRRRPGPEV